jgi:cobalt transporter subunit CbtA
MIGRIVLAALLAGLFAGLILGGIQYFRITPMIVAAEAFETAPPHQHDAAPEWQPADGLERTLYTTATVALIGAGYALVLAAISLLSGIPISRANCLIWGVCGFMAMSLAPAAGLPPELPGMPAGDLVLRQVWWVATVAVTGLGLYLIATRRTLLPIALAVALIALPHLVGAPQPSSQETAVPAGLAAAFASSTLAAAAVFWSLIAVFLAYALKRFESELYAS